MGYSRREFARRSLSCAAYLLTALSLVPGSLRKAFGATSRGKVVAQEKFGRIEEIAEGAWALISTPFADGGPHFETVANGGIVAGRDGVLIVEALYTEEGAAWLARHARELTGREPTHVIVTHHHADHARGIRGIENERGNASPALKTFATATARNLLAASDSGEVKPLLPRADIEEGKPTRIDLGGRSVKLVPRLGHTPSDVTVELEEPGIVWCGDLVWNGMFPNYVDAVPSQLARHTEALLARQEVVFVPGHGDLPDADQLAAYRAVIAEVERAARVAHERGVPAADAAAKFNLPDSLGTWTMFAPDLYERAFNAWERELGGKS